MCLRFSIKDPIQFQGSKFRKFAAHHLVKNLYWINQVHCLPLRIIIQVEVGATKFSKL